MSQFNPWGQINRDAGQSKAFGELRNTRAVVAEPNASPIVQVGIDGNIHRKALYGWSTYGQDEYS